MQQGHETGALAGQGRAGQGTILKPKVQAVCERDSANASSICRTQPQVRLVVQVDAARALARDAYRADQASIEKQKTWKTRVGELKEAQDNLRITKEAFYRWVVYPTFWEW